MVGFVRQLGRVYGFVVADKGRKRPSFATGHRAIVKREHPTQSLAEGARYWLRS